LVDAVGDLEVSVLATSEHPQEVERHLDLEELRAVAFNRGDCRRASSHIGRCKVCEGLVKREREDNLLIEEDDGDPT
jgi:hypothetical protein